MAKNLTYQRQASLIKHNIPSMPEGYYSSHPNPNLRRFVEEHSNTYNPKTDKYSRKPFDEPIIDVTSSAIFDIHPYWSKKPHGAIARYILHYTHEGDLILDPFTGSGGVNAVSCQINRPSIGIDISPASTFIAKHLCTPYNIGDIENLYHKMHNELQQVRDYLYATRCHRCNGRAEVQYLVWSQTYQCSKCLEIVSHYECINGNTCPYCNENVKTNQKRYGYIPVLANIKCLEGCTPARCDRALDSRDQELVRAFNNFDLTKIQEIDDSNIPYWYPTEPFPKEWVSWRPNLQEAGNVSGFFTKRNLWAAASIVDWIEKHRDSEAASWLMLSFTGSVMSISKKAQHLEGGGGYIPGNYVFPPEIKERNVFNTYESIFLKMLRGVEEINQRVKTTAVLLSTQSSLDLSTIPDNSIDYVFTDPPYSDKVPFGEFNFLWEVWLREGFSWDKDEIIVNPKLGKDYDDWKKMLQEAVSELYRVLKPNRWISVCYHDTSEGSWMYLQDIFSEVGFISEKIDNVLSIERERKSWKQATTSQVQKRDLVINFRKPRPGEVSGQMILFDEIDFETFQDAAKTILSETLIAHPGTSADRLFDSLVSRTIRKGQFERHDFDALLRSVAEESPVGSGRWYLLATAGQIDEAESTKEEAGAEKLEVFMQMFLQSNPSEAGVHYSDLFEQYLPIKDKPRRLLQDWLPEYFFKTAEGTWRPPLTDDERKQKAALRSSGALRRIKRFANALLEGVPPYEKDKPDNAATLADWIRQCRRAGLYDLGRVLYEKGGLRFDGMGEEAQLEVDEDYQVCVRRSEKSSAKKPKSKQPGLLED